MPVPVEKMIRATPHACRRRARLLGIVTLLLVAGGIVAWRLISRSRIDQGIKALQAAYSHTRPLEARLTMFAYAPMLVTRGEATDQVDPAIRDRAALLLSGGDQFEWDARTRHAVAMYYLTDGRVDQAIGLLVSALGLEPNNADIHSDLSAVYLERAVAGREKPAIHDLARSLEHSSRAIELNSSLLAAHFNRALCLQRMNIVSIATEAWEDYARRDADSGWSGEAARKLQLLQEENTLTKTAVEVLEDFLAAYREKNEARAWRIHSQSREMITGTMIPFQLARGYLECGLRIADCGFQIGSEQTGEHANLTRQSAIRNRQSAIRSEALEGLAFVGEMEKKRTGDPFFAELARFYSRAAERKLADLCKAQEAMQQGYGLCLEGHYAQALPRFKEAQKFFHAAGNRWEPRVTDYWIAYCLTQRGATDRSLALLNALADHCETRSYHWLKAEAYYWLSNNSALLGEHSGVIEQAISALSVATDIGDLYNAQKNASHLARTYKELGRADEALRFHQVSLPSSGDYFASSRQYWRSLNSLTDMLSALRMYAAAEAYQREALQVAVSRLADPVLIHNSYVRLAQIQTGRRSYSKAEQSLRSSLEAIQQIQQDRSTARLAGQSALQLGNVRRLSGDYNAALNHYREALEQFKSLQAGPFAYVTRKGMLECHLANNDDAAVRQELSAVLSLFEDNRRKIREEQNRNSFFDVEQDVYDLAIDFEHSRNNTEASFNYAEFSRARSLLDQISRTEAQAGVFDSAAAQPMTQAQLVSRLPSDLQIVQYAVLQDRLLMWVLRDGRLEALQSPVASSALAGIANEYLSILPRGDAESVERERQLAAQLYDWIFAPIEAHLDSGKDVAVIPDKFLFKIPFAAFLSPRTGRRVIEDYALLYSPSATVLALCTNLAETKSQEKKAETLLSVGNPRFDRKRYPELDDLPNAAAEARKIASFYQDPAVLVGDDAVKEQVKPRLLRADVIHIAGHYVPDDISPAKSRLLLAAPRGTDVQERLDTLSLEEIQSERLARTKLAVLAACQSGVERYYAGEGLIGLSRAFIMAGVPLVVGSQWPVESESTYRLMTDFHRLRKAEVALPTARALRQAQFNLINGQDVRYQRPYFWAGFFALGGHAEY